ncbi:MAG: hypothetical protein ACRDKT_03850 [Actinomycetota bacterium]
MSEQAALARALEGEAPRNRYDAVAEVIRADGDYRWVGLYGVQSDEIAALGWSGVGLTPAFPADQGLGGAVASGRPVVSNDVHGRPIVGLVDVESGELDAFGDDDVTRLRRWAVAIVERWPF